MSLLARLLKTSVSAREVLVQFPGLSNLTVKPTANHHSDVYVLPRRKAEISPATRYTLVSSNTAVSSNEDLILLQTVTVYLFDLTGMVLLL